MDLQSKIKEKIERLDEFTVISADIMPVIKELAEVDWSSGKRKMTIACRKLLQIAESDEPVAKSFMRALNKAVKEVATVTESRYKAGKIGNKKKLEEDK